MATKARGTSGGKKKQQTDAEVAAAMANAETVSVAYHPGMLNEFVTGNITLGELEGVGKDVQYQIAEQGYKLLNEGKLEDAEKVYRGLITLDPFDSYFHTVLGSIFQRRDMKDEAIEEYTRALKVNPYNATALANRGEVYFQAGKILEATQDIQAAITNDPECKEPATLRCRVLAMALSKIIEENKDKILKSMERIKKEGTKKPGKKKAKKSAGKTSKKATKKTKK